ncbi:MAG: hypothetical protein IJN43_05055 [Ruminococcus sp.]|nr:hypothetical protein [Ruminococcus sp.]
MNAISAIAFLLSSFCLLFIPFVNLTDGMPGYAYVIAAVFWVGLLVGVSLQIYLKSKCKKLKVKNTQKRFRICYAVALLAFSIFVILAVLKSRSSIAVVGSLFCTIVSLQSAAILKRRECLK